MIIRASCNVHHAIIMRLCKVHPKSNPLPWRSTEHTLQTQLHIIKLSLPKSFINEINEKEIFALVISKRNVFRQTHNTKLDGKERKNNLPFAELNVKFIKLLLQELFYGCCDDGWWVMDPIEFLNCLRKRTFLHFLNNKFSRDFRKTLNCGFGVFRAFVFVKWFSKKKLISF